MADGDILHTQLGLYKSPYLELCKEELDENEFTRRAIQSLIKDIKRKGSAAIVLAKCIGELLLKQIDTKNFPALSLEIDKLVRQANIPHMVQELVRSAAKFILHEFRYRQRIDTSNLPEAVVRQYIKEIYKSGLEGRIPLICDADTGVDPTTVKERLEELDPQIGLEIDKLAKKATADEDVKNLRRSRRNNVKEIDLDEDLL